MELLAEEVDFESDVLESEDFFAGLSLPLELEELEAVLVDEALRESVA